MKKLILDFTSKHLPNFEVSFQESEDDLINIYIERKNNKYFLVSNLNTLKKLNLTDEELLALLWHEKGHHALNHLEVTDNYQINLMLIIMLSFIFIPLIVIIFFIPLLFIFSFLCGFIMLFLQIENLKILKRMRKSELEADIFASKHCNPESYISLLNKLNIFYTKKPSLFNLFGTHPLLSTRIKNIH